MAKKKKKGPQVKVKKESISLFTVHNKKTGKQIYPGNGLPEVAAQRLADGLLKSAEIHDTGKRLNE